MSPAQSVKNYKIGKSKCHFLFSALIFGMGSSIGWHVIIDNLDLIKQYVYQVNTELYLPLTLIIIIFVITYFQMNRSDIMKFNIQIRNIIIIMNITYILSPLSLIEFSDNFKIIILLLFVFINSVAYSIFNFSFITFTQFLGRNSLILFFIGNIISGLICNISKLILFHVLKQNNNNPVENDSSIFNDNIIYHLKIYCISIFAFVVTIYLFTLYVFKISINFITNNKMIYFSDYPFRIFIENNCSGNFNIEKQLIDTEIKSEVSSLDKKILTESMLTEIPDNTIQNERKAFFAIFSKLPGVFIIMTINSLICYMIFPGILLKIISFYYKDLKGINDNADTLNENYFINFYLFIYNSFDLLGRILALIKGFTSQKCLCLSSVFRIYFWIIFLLTFITEKLEYPFFLYRNLKFFIVNLAGFGFSNGLSIISCYNLIRKKIERILLGKAIGIMYFSFHFGAFLGILLLIFFQIQ